MRQRRVCASPCVIARRAGRDDRTTAEQSGALAASLDTGCTNGTADISAGSYSAAQADKHIKHPVDLEQYLMEAGPGGYCSPRHQTHYERLSPAGIARHVISCHLPQETGIHSALDDEASNIRQALDGGRVQQDPGGAGRPAHGGLRALHEPADGHGARRDRGRGLPSSTFHLNLGRLYRSNLKTYRRVCMPRCPWRRRRSCCR